MNTKNIITTVIIILITFGFFYLINNSSTQKPIEKKEEDRSEITNAEKIEVIHFYTTQQCWACITLGELSLKTIEEKFPNEYEKGIITFQDINVDLAENKELVSKYQARGSSLFINAIVDGEDNIEEDVAVWRLIGNEKQYIEYLSEKLNGFLGE